MMTSQLPDRSLACLAQRQDLSGTDLWKEVESYFQQLHSPAFGKISGAAHLAASPDGYTLAFTGSILDKLNGVPYTRICVADIKQGTIKIITYGPHSDCLAQWSPDGRSLAFLSDRIVKGVFQLYLLDLESLGEAHPVGHVDGTAETISWSPCGTKILIGVAGRGADKAGADGSGTTAPKDASHLPTWLPSVDPGADENPWRTAWIYHRIEDRLVRASRKGLNVWEVVWCGNQHLVAVVSSAPDEGAWNTATLAVVDIATGTERTLYRSARQIGLPVVSPSTKRVALIEALCSDRGVIAGDVLIIDVASGSSFTLAANQVDTSQLVWQNDEQLFFFGLRGQDSVAGILHTSLDRSVDEIWTSPETCGFRFPEGCLLAEGQFAVVLESWTRYQELALVTKGHARTIVSLDHDGARYLRSKLGPIERVSWSAPDGLEIQGYLCLPRNSAKPYPLILYVHGGPCSAFRNKWVMRDPIVALLVSCGYAVLCPNPRGSKGRGHEFTSGVYGDMGGADTHDLLSGVEAMIARGIADPERVGVSGRSYGGFMSAWLITQSDRFAAAVPVAPVTHWASKHTTCNNPDFDKAFLQADPYAPDGRYFTRSPLMYAGRFPTPVLQIAGALDRCTPPTQAVQYHRALIEHGVNSVIAVYPGEGHGVNNFPAYIDFSCRVLSWFRDHMPA